MICIKCILIKILIIRKIYLKTNHQKKEKSFYLIKIELILILYFKTVTYNHNSKQAIKIN